MGEKDAVRIFGSTDIVGKELDVTLYGKEMGLTIIGVEKASEDSMFSFTYENSPIELQIPLITFSTMYGMDTESFWQIMIFNGRGRRYLPYCFGSVESVRTQTSVQRRRYLSGGKF